MPFQHGRKGPAVWGSASRAAVICPRQKPAPLFVSYQSAATPCFNHQLEISLPKELRTRLSLRPGQPGTKRLLQRFGHRLVRVRYLHDAATGRHLKTVELIVAEWDWPPPPSPPSQPPTVALRVGWDEDEVRRRVKAAGGRWDAARRVWWLRGDQARRLGLLGRVVEGAHL
jgi:hypothetical protein